MPRCSIIIPVYNKAHLTRQCLDRLFAVTSPSTSFEVVVVDDASRDATPQMLAGYGDRVRVVTHAQNKAFATSCNDGALYATGDYLVFLNNDTIPYVGWLDALVRYAEVRPKVGLVGNKLLFPDGTIQHAGMAFGQDRQPRHIYVNFPADHPAVNKARRMQAVTGACNLIPREVFAATGGFDPGFINGYEDVDLCLRVGGLGYEVHYCPESVLIHLEGVSEGRFKFEAHSARLFRERWWASIRPDDLNYFLDDGLIRINYFPNYVEFYVSPELGFVVGKDGFADAERVLCQRAKQVYELVRENVTMRASGIPGRLPAGAT
ncbi:glycosyltransferase family 2 protein [Fimbriiglobus ruber]|uniref:Glycosyltransferase n=1 Tax=Fimbriiglobus ruber TaxID=1908690 RepID=A0A225DS81_9BACT|nr:glycosyltransferase family 2 protein [Fimbriiglobus ruber]OWK43923.1 glycosyltransferase [Fimbriiglobus ruber]